MRSAVSFRFSSSPLYGEGQTRSLFSPEKPYVHTCSIMKAETGSRSTAILKYSIAINIQGSWKEVIKHRTCAKATPHPDQAGPAQCSHSSQTDDFKERCTLAPKKNLVLPQIFSSE